MADKYNSDGINNVRPGVLYTDWYRMYRDRWLKDDVEKSSMSHPAKFARGLIKGIYDHCKDEGWLHPNDCVVDPFGGVALGALDPITRGINWVGVEVEAHHHTRGMGGHCDGEVKVVETSSATRRGWYVKVDTEQGIMWGDAQLVFDESGTGPGYQTKEEVEKAWNDIAGNAEFSDLTLMGFEYKTFKDEKTTPAICGLATKHEPHDIEGNIGMWNRKYSKLFSPFGAAVLLHGDSRYLAKVLRDNADKLPFLKSAPTLGVSSPPFLQTSGGTNVTSTEGALSDPRLIARHAAGNAAANGYGDSNGQIEAMPEGDFDQAITSPVYADTRITGKGDEGDSGLRNEDGSYVRGSEGWELRKALGGRYGDQPGQLANMDTGESGFDNAVSSPPYNLPFSQEHNGKRGGERGTNPSESGAFTKYGNADGQIEGMSDQNFDAAVSSPPFTGTSSDGGWQMLGKYAEQGKLTVDQVGGDPNKSYPSWDKDRDTSYGTANGQLADMDDSGFSAAVSSPPYADIAQSGGTKGLIEHGTGLTQGQRAFDEYGSSEGQAGRMNATDDGFNAAVSSPPFEAVTSDRPSSAIVSGGLRMGASSMGDGYGEAEGQIGNTFGEDFWTASRMILDNLMIVLKPGAHACFVVKRFVKEGKIEDFPEKWALLCEAAGFKVVHWHKAWVIEDKGTQLDLFGNAVHKVTERKSFFRRLAERKGSPRIDFEEVICVQKPYADGTWDTPEGLPEHAH